MTIGEKIKRLRIEKHMTQEELGALVGVQKQAIYKYETGLVVNLKRQTIAKLAKALDTSPIYLMGIGEEEKEKPAAKSNELKSTTKEILAIVENLPENLQRVAVEQMRALAAASKIQDKH